MLHSGVADDEDPSVLRVLVVESWTCGDAHRNGTLPSLLGSILVPTAPTPLDSRVSRGSILLSPLQLAAVLR